MKFKAWLAKVDAALIRISGVGMDDLPDDDFVGMFEEGLSPVAAARRVLVEAGW